MIKNKSTLRKKIKEANALKKDIYSNPFGMNVYQLSKIQKEYSKIISSAEPQPVDEPVEPKVSAQPKQLD